MIRFAGVTAAVLLLAAVVDLMALAAASCTVPLRVHARPGARRSL